MMIIRECGVRGWQIQLKNIKFQLEKKNTLKRSNVQHGDHN